MESSLFQSPTGTRQMSDIKRIKEITDIQINFWENMCSFLVSILPADGLAPPSTTPSAGAVMNTFGPVCKRDHHLTVVSWLI